MRRYLMSMVRVSSDSARYNELDASHRNAGPLSGRLRGKPRRRRLIHSLEALTADLVCARANHPAHVHALLHGRLDLCLAALANDQPARLDRKQAVLTALGWLSPRR